MKEPEVSLTIALYYIRNGLTNKNVNVSIDGAHIKTGSIMHFDIIRFMIENNCTKSDNNTLRWQGEYNVLGHIPKIIISSKPGEGDVNITLTDGKELHIESKKILKGKNNHEYPAMREAIGQLMTGYRFSNNKIPIVAVPYTPKSAELAERWSKLPQIKSVGIRFILVFENGSIKMI